MDRRGFVAVLGGAVGASRDRAISMSIRQQNDLLTWMIEHPAIPVPMNIQGVGITKELVGIPIIARQN